MAVWTTPTTRTSTELIEATDWNTDVKGNLDFLGDFKVAGTALSALADASEIGAVPMLKSGSISADAASVSLASYTAVTPRFYMLVVSNILTDRAAAYYDHPLVRFNGDTTAANYNTMQASWDNAGANIANAIGTLAGIQANRCASAANADAGCYGFFVLIVMDPENTTDYKHCIGIGGQMSDTTAELTIALFGGIWLSTAAITSITLVPQNGTNFLAGGASEPATMNYALYAGL